MTNTTPSQIAKAVASLGAMVETGEPLYFADVLPVIASRRRTPGLTYELNGLRGAIATLNACYDRNGYLRSGAPAEHDAKGTVIHYMRRIRALLDCPEGQ